MRSVTLARRLLTFGFQVELGVNAYVTPSGTHQDATSEHTVEGCIAAIGSDIHRNKLEGRRGTGRRNQAVGIARIPLVVGYPVLTAA